MIRYDLICVNDHRFDGWFRDSDGFDNQCREGEVVCPHCGSPKIEKALMTPGLPVKSNATRAPQTRGETTVLPPVPDAGDPRATAFLQAMRALRSHVEANADDVGDRFAEEARRIYYAETGHDTGDTPGQGAKDGGKDEGKGGKDGKRGIYGKATLEDAKALHEEGIDVLPLPILPEDQN